MSTIQNKLEGHILPHILKVEGGFVHHVNDRGGATNYGITLDTYSAHLGRPATVNELKAISMAEVEQIYNKRYYGAMGLDRLKSGKVALAMMDQGVNRGTRRVVRQAQLVANEEFGQNLAVDGINGPKTSGAINSLPEMDFSREFLQSSMHSYVDIVKRRNDQMVFLSGWVNRVQHVEDVVYTGSSKIDPVVTPKPDDKVTSDLGPYKWAKGEVGTKEIRGSRHNPRILWYHDFTTLDAGTDEISWCSSFMCAAHEVNGLPSTDSAAARSWLKYGEEAPGNVGDIVVFWRVKPDSWQGHVGFVARKYTPGDEFIYVLGGNQSNQVKYSYYKASQLLGFRKAA
jgi:uncharacterized protein (TIGR02594 family)